jgi:hypothetical protein
LEGDCSGLVQAASKTVKANAAIIKFRARPVFIITIPFISAYECKKAKSVSLTKLAAKRKKDLRVMQKLSGLSVHAASYVEQEGQF